MDSFEEVEFYGRLRLIARCHGATELVELEASEAAGLVFGVAFHEPRRLTP